MITPNFELVLLYSVFWSAQSMMECSERYPWLKQIMPQASSPWRCYLGFVFPAQFKQPVETDNLIVIEISGLTV